MFNTIRMEGNYSIIKEENVPLKFGMGVYIGHHFCKNKKKQFLIEVGFIETKNYIPYVSYGSRVEKDIIEHLRWLSFNLSTRFYLIKKNNMFIDFSLLMNIALSGRREGYYYQDYYTHFGVTSDEGNFKDEILFYGLNILPGSGLGYKFPVRHHELFVKSGFNYGIKKVTEEKWDKVRKLKSSYFYISLGFTF